MVGGFHEGEAVMGFWLHVYYKRVRGMAHYEPYALLEVNVFRLRKHIFLWKCTPDNFYKLGKYLKAKVAPLDNRWPHFVHKMYADFSVRKAAG